LRVVLSLTGEDMTKKKELTLAEQVRKMQKDAEREAPTLDLLDQIKKVGLPAPEREVVFHPVRLWRFDLAWKPLKFAVEVDGGIWTGGRHSRGGGYEEDCIKFGEAAALDWTVIRVTPGMIKDGRAIGLIEKILTKGG
jgi:hypothetical protein